MKQDIEKSNDCNKFLMPKQQWQRDWPTGKNNKLSYLLLLTTLFVQDWVDHNLVTVILNKNPSILSTVFLQKKNKKKKKKSFSIKKEMNGHSTDQNVIMGIESKTSISSLMVLTMWSFSKPYWVKTFKAAPILFDTTWMQIHWKQWSNRSNCSLEREYLFRFCSRSHQQ